MVYVGTLLISLLFSASLEWHTNEDLVIMVVLVFAGAFIGWLCPRLFFLSGLLVGLVVPVLNMLSLTTGVHPSYEGEFEATGHGIIRVLSLSVLVIPAVMASFAGRSVGLHSGLGS